MGKFAKNVDPKAVAAKQASNIMKQIQGSDLLSVGTVRNYETRLAIVAETVNKNLECSLRDITPTIAHQYLTDRALEVGSKTLDMERQAIQCMMQNVTGKLAENEKLDVIKSIHSQVLSSGSYTPDHVSIIANSQNERNALATEIAYDAGLRAHELLTLQRIEERTPDPRPSDIDKFANRAPGERYTVMGKGGLIREVMISKGLSEKLEERRLSTPLQISDRGIHYSTHYDLGAGQKWSSSFSSASKRSLNWSAGAHGLRHSYAQVRMSELQKITNYDHALKIVSQEMGHFRAEITEVYLR